MAYSRMEKYQELRDGLKDEVGIQKPAVLEDVPVEDDDFLSFMNEEVNIEDTVTEFKTFEQIKQEGSKEVDKALKSAKESVGKEEQYNTRLDILNKIRGNNQQIVVDSYDQFDTSEFSQGMFLRSKKQEEPTHEMTLMEKLASMSPKEDAQKAKEFLENEETENVEEPVLQIQEDLEEIMEDETEQPEAPKTLGEKIAEGIILILVVVIFVLLALHIKQLLF